MQQVLHPRQLTQYSGIALRAGVLVVLLMITLAVVGGRDAFSFIKIDRPFKTTTAFVPTNSTAREVGRYQFKEINSWDYQHVQGADKLVKMLFIENNTWDYRPELIPRPEMVFTELNSWDYPERPERISRNSMVFMEYNSWDHTNQPILFTRGIQNR